MKKIRKSIVAKSIIGIMVPLIVLSVIVCILGFRAITDAMMTLYETGALEIADTAAADIDANRMDAYEASGGETKEYKDVWHRMDSLCQTSDATFIYVIRPDLSDFAHIKFLFSTINANSDYEVYPFGYLRETTNDEYKAKYKALYDGVSRAEIVVRDNGYIETDAHITAMVPLVDSEGRTQAILCVQRQMENLTAVRNFFLLCVLAVLVILVVITALIQNFYMRRVLLTPLKHITAEASRFAEQESLPEQKLQEIVRNQDEIGGLAESVDRMEENITQYMQDLTSATAEKERISTELSLATRIQAGMLPSVFPPFPEREEFDLYASMDPAKEVGGDFYDFFLVDEDHLCLLIADVSGKGIPAALFMMASQIVLSNLAKQGLSPAEILERANRIICEQTREDMFVTAWLGVLTISTGRLVAANAGHEYPALRKPDGRFELLKDKHGLVIGGIEGASYKEYEIQMLPDSKLFLYTDGVAEATDQNNEQFGTDRMIDALNLDPSASPKQLLKNVRTAVDAFVQEAEQFDDLTMLCLEYKGGQD